MMIWRSLWMHWLTWGLIALFHTTLVWSDWIRAGQEMSWLSLIVRLAAGYAPWFLISPLVFWWVRRHPIHLDRAWQSTLRQVGFAIAIFVVYLPIAVWIQFSWLEQQNAASFSYWFLDLFLLAAAFGLANAVELQRLSRQRQKQTTELNLENERLAKELLQAKIHLLRAQIEPHFLFNSLNSISALIRSGEPEKAIRALSLLSDLLRYATRATELEQVSLAEELDFAEAYLDLQQLRFGDRLVSHWEIEQGLEDLAVPPLILQPLLENAVRHGVEPNENPTRLDISAKINDDQLDLRVDNQPRSTGSEGLRVGLSNTRRRLRLLFGDRAELHLDRMTDRFSARMTFPLERL